MNVHPLSEDGSTSPCKRVFYLGFTLRISAFPTHRPFFVHFDAFLEEFLVSEVEKDVYGSNSDGDLVQVEDSRVGQQSNLFSVLLRGSEKDSFIRSSKNPAVPLSPILPTHMKSDLFPLKGALRVANAIAHEIPDAGDYDDLSAGNGNRNVGYSVDDLGLADLLRELVYVS